MNRVIVQSGADRQFVLYWYQSHGRIVASEYWSKRPDRGCGPPESYQDGSLVRVMVPIAGDGADAERRAEALATGFVADLLPQLHGFLPQ